MDELAKALALDVRKRIYNQINRSPGLHFREIQRRTKLATGSLQYHVDYLQKKHLIRSVKEGKFVRFYSIRGKQLGEATKTMSLLRQESIRKIVIFLLTEKKANNSEIAAGIGLQPSTTSFHLDKMVKAEIVDKVRKGRKTLFYLERPEEAANLLVGYRRSFFDDMVNNFVDVWEEMAVE